MVLIKNQKQNEEHTTALFAAYKLSTLSSRNISENSKGREIVAHFSRERSCGGIPKRSIKVRIY